MSDALGDDVFEIFDVFLVETFFLFFSKLITLHGPTAAKKAVAPQKVIFCSLSVGDLFPEFSAIPPQKR